MSVRLKSIWRKQNLTLVCQGRDCRVNCLQRAVLLSSALVWVAWCVDTPSACRCPISPPVVSTCAIAPYVEVIRHCLNRAVGQDERRPSVCTAASCGLLQAHTINGRSRSIVGGPAVRSPAFRRLLQHRRFRRRHLVRYDCHAGLGYCCWASFRLVESGCASQA